jgi:hypothetical protein
MARRTTRWRTRTPSTGRSTLITAAQRDLLWAYPRIVAIVAYDEPTEQLRPQAL